MTVRPSTPGQRLAQAEATLEALRRGEVDAIVGRDDVMLLRLRAAEAALQASEARYRTLLDTIDEGFCVVEVRFDDQGRAVDYKFLEANAAFEATTGIRDPVGRWMREMHPDQDWMVSVRECSCDSCSESALGLASDRLAAPPEEDEEPSD